MTPEEARAAIASRPDRRRSRDKRYSPEELAARQTARSKAQGIAHTVLRARYRDEYDVIYKTALADLLNGEAS